jgi:hypothetical protein
MSRMFSLFRDRVSAAKKERIDAQDGLDPVVVIQTAMADPSAGGLAKLSGAFEDIVGGEIWRGACPSEGDSFESFGAFATAAAPAGLNIRSREAASLARHVLLQTGLYEAWTQILERIVRRPGRPPKNCVNDGDFRFYPLSKAPHAKDRLLLLLKERYPDHFKAVCNGECTPYRAAVNAGAVLVGVKSKGEKPRLRFGVFHLEAVALLSPKAQQTVLHEVFSTMPIDAQCSLIENELEPTLGQGLARKWQSRHTGS